MNPLDVSPRRPFDYFIYSGPRDAISPSDVGPGSLAAIKQFSDGDDILCRQLCVRVPFACPLAFPRSSGSTWTEPPLGVHIGTVIRLGSQPEMVRITTRRIVTGMKDAESIGNVVPMRHGPRDAVDQQVLPGNQNLPVSLLHPGALPRPAGIRATGAIHLGPEQTNGLGGKLVSHLRPPSGCHAGVVPATPGTFTSSPFYHEGGL
jgi:hypothetical protein